MEVVETKHFIQRWKDRVGKYDPEVRELVKTSIKFGNARLHEKKERGVLVAVRYKNRNLSIVGFPSRKRFVMQTVLRSKVAGKLGWNSMKLNIPNEMKRHICMVCGDPCIPMTSGDGWFNEEKGVTETLIFCFNCAREVGEKVFKKASTNTDHYLGEVTRWST